MSDETSAGQDDSLKTAFWITDLMVDALCEIHALTAALAANGASPDSVDMIIRGLDGLAVGFGVLQGALVDLRLTIPEVSK